MQYIIASPNHYATVYIRYLGLILLITVHLYPLTNMSQFLPPPPAPGNPFSVSMSLMFLDSSYKWDNTKFIFLSLTHFTYHNAFKVHLHCTNGRISFFYMTIIFHHTQYIQHTHTHTSHLYHLFICSWTHRLLSCLVNCE